MQNIKLTDIIIKHNDIKSIESRVVIYNNGTTVQLTPPELEQLLAAFAIHGVGQHIPVKA